MRRLKRFIREWFVGPKLLSALLWFRKFEVARNVPFRLSGVRLDWKDKTESSLHELRVATQGEVVWIPLTKVRTVYGLAFSIEQHPFVRYLRDGFPTLLKFYQLHQPSSLSELFFLSNGDTPIRKDSHSNRVWPWASGSQSKHFVHMPGTMASNRRQESRAWSDALRLDHIFRSVVRRGFWMPENDAPTYFILVDDVKPVADHRVVLVQGSHRVSVLAFLDWRLIPMTPEFCYSTPEIRRSHLKSWPGVVDGTFSHESAEQIFLAFFRSEQGVLLSEW